MDFIDDRHFRQLQIQMSKWKRNEPGTFQAVHGELMNRLVTANGGLDVVARELDVRRAHLAQLCNRSHPRVA